MSIEEDAAFLKPYRQLSEQGHILDVREIKVAYVEEVEHSIGSSRIDRVLNQHVPWPILYVALVSYLSGMSILSASGAYTSVITMSSGTMPLTAELVMLFL